MKFIANKNDELNSNKNDALNANKNDALNSNKKIIIFLFNNFILYHQPINIPRTY
jgi:hypothetical protein